MTNAALLVAELTLCLWALDRYATAEARAIVLALSFPGSIALALALYHMYPNVLIETIIRMLVQ